MRMEDTPVEDGNTKKIVVGLLAVFLIFLMVSYFSLSYGVDDMIAGMFASSPVADGKVIFDEGKIVFLEESYQKVLEAWDGNNGLEFKACFLGEKKGEEYLVHDIFFPEALEQTYRSILAEDCPAGTIVNAHSHPFKRCIASFQDVLNQRRFKAEHPDALMAVLCDRERMNVYS